MHLPVLSDRRLLSDLPSMTIQSLAALPDELGVWVIDIHENIGCPASQFEAQFMAKLRGYDDETVKSKGTTKVILTESMEMAMDDMEVVRPLPAPGAGAIPTAEEWGRDIVTAPLSGSTQIPLPQRRLTPQGRSVREGDTYGGGPGGLSHVGPAQSPSHGHQRNWH